MDAGPAAEVVLAAIGVLGLIAAPLVTWGIMRATSRDHDRRIVALESDAKEHRQRDDEGFRAVAEGISAMREDLAAMRGELRSLATASEQRVERVELELDRMRTRLDAPPHAASSR